MSRINFTLSSSERDIKRDLVTLWRETARKVLASDTPTDDLFNLLNTTNNDFDFLRYLIQANVGIRDLAIRTQEIISLLEELESGEYRNAQTEKDNSGTDTGSKPAEGEKPVIGPHKQLLKG